MMVSAQPGTAERPATASSTKVASVPNSLRRHHVLSHSIRYRQPRCGGCCRTPHPPAGCGPMLRAGWSSEHLAAAAIVLAGESAHLVDGNDLTVGLLHAAQLAHEVPEAAARDDVVPREQVHAVHLAHGRVRRVLLIGHEASHHLVLRLPSRQRTRSLLAH